MRRKQRSPTPAFKQPQPFSPIAGEYAQLAKHGPLSRVAMMQVIEDDTHDNYVVCQGFDPETLKFYSRLSIAKPYGLRGTFPYKVAEVYAACKARSTLGDTPGVAHTTIGYPADLDEVVDILYDDDQKAISYILLDARSSGGTDIKSAVLRCDLNLGLSCVIEHTEFIAGTLTPNGKTYRAFNRHGQLDGTANMSCCDWIFRPDTPTAEELDGAGIALPEGAPEPTEAAIAEILIITCRDFLGCPCATPPE